MKYEVELLSYLPAFLQGTKEFKGISTAASPEFSVLYGAENTLMDNGFIHTADLQGIRRWEQLLGISGAMEEMAQVQTDDVSISLLYIVLSVAGAVVEELFFRGILLNLCRPYDRAASAIIISAVLFAVMHLSPLMMLHTFISGLVFGYFYYHTENIYIPILMHLTNNLLWSTALNAWLFGPFMSLTGELQGAVIMVVAGLVMVICSTAVFTQKYVK